MVQPGGEALNVALSSAAVCATSYAKHRGRMHCHCSKSLRSGVYTHSNLNNNSVLCF